MGILDEAIREHLDLKREHGAEEAELKDLESEAFGPAERPDALSPSDTSGSSDSSTISPAGEDEMASGSGAIFDSTSEDDPGDETRVMPLAPSDTGMPDDSAGEESSSEEAKAESQPDGEATVETPAAERPDASEAEPEPEQQILESKGKDDDAGDLLEAERSHLSSYPTEHYDVDAAIAEEDEIDLLSERSLSDELDRALDGPTEATESEPASDPSEVTDPDPDPDPAEEEPEAEFEPEFEAAPEKGSVEEDAGEPESDEDPFEGEEGDDVLEATPEFLEETPEHDRLWFEQKEPKDFDFGD